MVADLHDDPLGEIVRISTFNQSMPEKIAMSMEVNRIQGNFFDQSCQLFLVIGLMGDAFLQFAAANE